MTLIDLSVECSAWGQELVYPEHEAAHPNYQNQVISDEDEYDKIQYVDFHTFSKGFPQTLPEILSCFLVPDGKTYNNGYDPAEVQRALLAMPWPEAVSLSAFFFARFSASIADSLTSLDLARRMSKDPKKRKVLERKIAEAEAALRRVGVGLPM